MERNERKWVCMPSGRWVTSLPSHRGELFVHAFVSGAWAVTRGKDIRNTEGMSTVVVRAIDDGQRHGSDLHEAMDLGLSAALAIAEWERLDHMGA